MISKGKIVISLLAIIGFLVGLYLMRNDTDFERRHSKGILRSLYDDSLSNRIDVVDYYMRSDHIILDNKYEYFLTTNRVIGEENLRGVLMDWVSRGDSIFKKSNEKQFTIKKNDGSEIIVYFDTN